MSNCAFPNYYRGLVSNSAYFSIAAKQNSSRRIGKFILGVASHVLKDKLESGPFIFGLPGCLKVTAETEKRYQAPNSEGKSTGKKDGKKRR